MLISTHYTDLRKTSIAPQTGHYPKSAELLIQEIAEGSGEPMSIEAKGGYWL
jgi:hypothetical protein